MATNHRFTLLPGSKKFLCPGCGKKRFVPFLDTTTGQHLPERYGRCDRAINCGYYLNPYSDGYAKEITDQESGQPTGTRKPDRPKLSSPQASPTPPPEPSFIPVEVMKQSRAGYQHNNFVLWLSTLFPAETVSQAIARYFIGTSKHWNGATVFWQIDQAGQIRSGKIMHYSPTTGKRTKEPFNHITWVHKALKLPNFELKQCYFGSHLLSQLNKPIALVESEKTAVIASIYLPEFIWLAVGSLTNLNPEKCRALSGRNVYLFPDLNGFELWSRKAKELSQQMPGTLFEVSDLLERNATGAEKASGLDLADYLLKYDLKTFSKQPAPTQQPKPLPAESEKGEKSEAPKTNIFLHPQQENESQPNGKNLELTSEPGKEFYRFTYSELCQAIGTDQANAKVKQYQELSEKYATCQTWSLHNCELLTTYYQSRAA
ncbi:DUF6371 domain-containing protein [Adhaeribacter terreus]|uniref:DUF6371 domain-containing protein n=1 Tax=Adhaeribacter terreus TaxID=529703 RepID=A0ABW0EAE8_9BACT